MQEISLAWQEVEMFRLTRLIYLSAPRCGLDLAVLELLPLNSRRRNPQNQCRIC